MEQIDSVIEIYTWIDTVDRQLNRDRWTDNHIDSKIVREG